jgi:hypothetical protein
MAALVLALIAAAAPVRLDAQTALGAARPGWVRCAGPSAPTAIEPFRRLTSLIEQAVVEPAIARVFAEREKEQRVSAPNLAGARVSIDFLYAAGQDATRVFYYEASKTIPDADGLLRVAVAGWLLGATSPRSMGAKSELHWAELAEADDTSGLIPEPATIPAPTASLVPLGVLTGTGQHTWVMKRAYGRGAVLVYEIGANGVRLRSTAAAPGC